MANTWTINPMVIIETEDQNESYEITSFNWFPNSASDTIKITDAAGTVVWEIKASAAAPNLESFGEEIKQFIPPRQMAGIYIETFGGGVLRIYKTNRSP